MNYLKAVFGFYFFTFSMNAYAIRFDELTWITQDQHLQDTLKQQKVLKTFEQPQMCRATFCYDYVICSADHNYEGEKTEYIVTKVSGSSIFFKRKLDFTTERFTILPEVCEEK